MSQINVNSIRDRQTGLNPMDPIGTGASFSWNWNPEQNG